MSNLAIQIYRNHSLIYIAVEDTGKFVKGILLNREKVLGKRIYGATKYYTLTEILNEFKEQFPVAGEGADNVELPHDVYKGILGSVGLSDEAQEELLQNMRLLNEFGYYGGGSLDESHSVSSSDGICLDSYTDISIRSWWTN